MTLLVQFGRLGAMQAAFERQTMPRIKRNLAHETCVLPGHLFFMLEMSLVLHDRKDGAYIGKMNIHVAFDEVSKILGMLFFALYRQDDRPDFESR